MKSLKHLYKKGIGPSSSHTMGPAKAAEQFLAQYGNLQQYEAILYGSLAMTGEGHGTDRAISRVFEKNGKSVKITFDRQSKCIHPNAMDFVGYSNGQVVRKQYFSIGGGEIVLAGEKLAEQQEVYAHNSFAEIKEYCKQHNLDLCEYAIKFEGEQILDYMLDIWHTMKKVIDEGLQQEGVLPGGLNVVRRAKKLYNAQGEKNAQTYQDRIVASYAFAVGEQNASGCEIVTAPTCGASGVLPAVFKFYQQESGCSDEKIARALLVSGIIGNIVKTNASISGAECGCQAEIGTACSMAAAGLAYLQGMTLEETEYSAEVALEHHLGLTCDPVCGLVQIPCIERNAVGAMRAINAVSLASFLTDSRKISFDTVVSAMYQTGLDLSENYRETANGGLAKMYKSS